MNTGTVAVTGGNGRVGGAVLVHLGEYGFRTVNLSRGKRREVAADGYLTTDLVDPGDVYGSPALAGPDAVVHLGIVPTPERTPGHVTFESNAMSTYHVLAAAEALDVGTVVLASSLSALGAGFEDDPVAVEYLPVDEAQPPTPSNPYGLGKSAACGSPGWSPTGPPARRSSSPTGRWRASARPATSTPPGTPSLSTSTSRTPPGRFAWRSRPTSQDTSGSGWSPTAPPSRPTARASPRRPTPTQSAGTTSRRRRA